MKPGNNLTVEWIVRDIPARYYFTAEGLLLRKADPLTRPCFRFTDSFLVGCVPLAQCCACGLMIGTSSCGGSSRRAWSLTRSTPQ